jgi:hypothetical protein
VRPAAGARGPDEAKLSSSRHGKANTMNAAQVGRHGLHLLMGAGMVLFLVFLYLFNFTAFF